MEKIIEHLKSVERVVNSAQSYRFLCRMLGEKHPVTVEYREDFSLPAQADEKNKKEEAEHEYKLLLIKVNRNYP